MVDSDSRGRVYWPGLMRLGLGVLRLSPEAFWTMTPAEFRHALEGAGIVPIGGTGLGRDRLAEMMAAFPDHAGPDPAPGRGPDKQT